MSGNASRLRRPTCLATVPVTMTRVGHALLMLVGGACLGVACSGSTPRDINFNTDAENGFEPPAREVTAETTESDAGGAGGAAGAAGGTAGAAGGTAGVAGGTAGAGGAGGVGGSVTDGGNDAVSDGGTG